MLFHEIIDCILSYILQIASYIFQIVIIAFFAIICISGIMMNLNLDVKDKKKSCDHKSPDEQS